MDLYGSLKSIHMIGAALLFLSLGFEAVATRRFRRAATADRARRAFRTLRRAGRAGYAAAAAILIPGVWMMALRWGPVAWTVTALVGIAIMAVASFRARPALRRLDMAFRRTSAEVPAEVPRSLRGVVASSLWLRTWIAVGILVLMNTKFGWVGSSAILAAAALFGLVAALRSEHRMERPRAQASVPTRGVQLSRQETGAVPR